jgi:hypothetical protein
MKFLNKGKRKENKMQTQESLIKSLKDNSESIPDLFFELIMDAQSQFLVWRDQIKEHYLNKREGDDSTPFAGYITTSKGLVSTSELTNYTT